MKEKTIREEFLESKNLYEYWDITDPKDIADWWIDRFIKLVESNRKAIEPFKSEGTNIEITMLAFLNGYNEALEDILSTLKK